MSKKKLYDEEIEAMEKRMVHASYMPWKVKPDGSISAPATIDGEGYRVVYPVSGTRYAAADEDLQFIAHARQDIPALIGDRDTRLSELWNLTQEVKAGKKREEALDEEIYHLKRTVKSLTDAARGILEQ